MILGPAITNLEKMVMKADSRLDDISWKLNMFETELCPAIVADDAKITVMNVLDIVTQLKEEYEPLKREVLELQKLERAVHETLQFKALKVRHRMITLHTRIKPRDQYGLQ